MRAMSHPRAFARQLPPAGDGETLRCARWRVALIALILAVSLTAAGQQLTIGTAPGGIVISGGAGNNYSASFGTMNALGIGTPATGVTVLPLGNGALYYTSINLIIPNVPGSHNGVITAYMNPNFGHSAALIAEGCVVNGSCATSGGYSAIGLTPATDTDLLSPPGIDNTTVQAGLAIFIPDNNGATAYSGGDTAKITIRMWDSVKTNKQLGKDITLSLTTQTVQTAVQLTLATAPGGVNIATALDYSLNFGNVNGLGIGPAPGLTTSAIAGGVIYSTPYLIKPAFAEFSSTTSTVKVAVTTDFQYPTVLNLRDASASGGPYTTLTTTPLQITNTAADRSSITRFLGLFVSNVNGPTAHTGTFNATLTFTLTVP